MQQNEILQVICGRIRVCLDVCNQIQSVSCYRATCWVRPLQEDHLLAKAETTTSSLKLGHILQAGTQPAC